MFIYYDESILTYIASIRGYYGLKSSYKTNPKLDEYLKNIKPKKIFQILIDGMGANLIEQKLNENSFLRRYLKFKTSTVFPTTTTAATTSILNGKAPNENAWLGWIQYVSELNDEIIPFYGLGYYSKIDYGKDIFNRLYPVENIVCELNEKGFKAKELYPAFKEDGCDSLETMCLRLKNYSFDDNISFIYAYWDEYDSLMHKYGPNAKICDDYLKFVDKQLEKLANELSDDTLLMIIADHGQVEINKIYNLANSQFDKYFYRRPTIETRALSFYVKEEYLKQFEKEFKELYEEEFILLNKKQVLDSKLFGYLENHSAFEKMLGEFIAIAKKDACFTYAKDGSIYPFKGQHAGITDDEIMIPIILFNKIEKAASC